MRIEQLRPENREANRQSAAKWIANNPVKARLKEKRWRAENPDKVRSYKKRWIDANTELAKAIARAAARRVRAERPELKRASEGLRRARKQNATPAWTELAAIKEFYAKCPPGHHVDHIVPLVHPLVCGLHVIANLQYLPASENCSKKNKFDVAAEWGRPEIA